MATVRWIVDTAGGDWPEYEAVYSVLEVAMAAAYDLVTAQESIVIDCTDSSGTGDNPDTTAVVVDGWTTSADYTLTIQAHENDQHGGVWDDTIYRLYLGHNHLSPYIFFCNIANTTVSGIQLSRDYSSSGYGIGFTNSDCICSDLYIKSASASNDDGIVFGSTGGVLRNCISVGWRAGITASAYESQFSTIKNNLAYGCTTGISAGARTDVTFTTCISINTTTDFIDLGTASDHNVSSDLTAPGTNTVQSFDHSTLFPNAATGDFRPSIPYTSALDTTWGAGAIPWQRDVLVNTDGSEEYYELTGSNLMDGATYDAEITYNAGTYTLNTNGGNEYITSTTEVAAGTSLKFSFDLANLTSGSVYPQVADFAHAITTDGSYEFYISVTANYFPKIHFTNLANVGAVISNLAVYETITHSETIILDTPTLTDGATDNGDGSYSNTSSFYIQFPNTLEQNIGYTIECLAVNSEVLHDGFMFANWAYGTYYFVPETNTTLTLFVQMPSGLAIQDIVLKKVVSDLPAYSSLAAAEAGEQTTGDDLALRNEKMVISCTSGGTTIADTTAVAVDANWNTSESCDFTVQAHENDRHVGVWDDEKYNLNCNIAEACIQVSAGSVGLNYLQLLNTHSSYEAICIVLNTTADFADSIKGCILESNSINEVANTTGIITIGYITYSGIVHITNNILSGATGTYGTGIGSRLYSERCNISNNTITGCTFGIVTNDYITDYNVVSNIIATSSTCFSLDPDSVPLTNISSDGTAPDNNTEYTVYYEDTDTLPVVPEDCVIFKSATDFRLVSHFVENYKGEMVETNSAIGNGTWLYDVNDDCAGKSREPYQFKGTRTARAFDIGAWQAPAQLTYVVDTDGVHGDYSSLATAFAGLQADSTDLVTDNLLPTISCQASTGVADTTYVIFAGVSTSEDCHVICEAAEGHRHNYIWDDAKYRLIVSVYDNALTLSSWSKIRFIQIENTHENGDGVAVSSEVVGSYIKSLLVRECNSGIVCVPDSDFTIENCIAYNCITGIYVYKYTSFSPSHLVKYNIVYGCTTGIYTYHKGLFLNNISVGNTTDFSINSSVDASSDHNVTLDLTSPNSGITGLSDTYFTDPANGDFTPVASAGDLTTYSASANSTVTVGAIPFVDEKIVDTGGTGDYENLATWEAYAQGACVSGETARANCEASTSQADTDAVTIAGFPSGVNIEVIGDNDTGIWDDSKYLLAPAVDATVLTIDNANIYASKLQLYPHAVALNCNSIYATSNALDVVINKCLINGHSSNYSRGIYISTPDGEIITIEYSVIHRCLDNLSSIYILNNPNILCRNNTSSHNNTVMIIHAKTNLSIVNMVANGEVNYPGTFVGVGWNNVSSDSSAPGTSPTINQNFTGDFVSATDFHTTDSPYELWGADAAYAGAFGDEPYKVVRVVDTDGVSGDYASLNAAVAYYQASRANLVERNEKALITCQASTSVADTAAVVVGNIATSSVNNIIIAGEFTIKWDTSKYRLSTIDTVCLKVDSVGNVLVQGIQAELYSDVSSVVLLRGEWCDASFAFNVLRSSGGVGTYCNGISLYYPLDGKSDAYGNIIQDIHGHGIAVNSSSSLPCGVYNNTIYNCDATGIGGGYHQYDVINNVSIDNNLDYDSDSNLSSNNISSDSSAPGTDSHTGETALNLFVDAAGGDFRLKSTATNAIGGGVDLSDDFTTDITGATREVPWDIGAFKYIDLGGGVTLVLSDGQHDHAADALDLLQLHILSLVDSYHGHNADGLTLLQQHLLAVVDAAQAHVADNLILEQIHNLTVAGSDHAHTADNLALLQQHLLNLLGADHAHTADQLDLLQQHLLAILDSAHDHFAEELNLIQQHLVEILETNHAHVVGELDLVQQHLLTLEDADHNHTAETLALIQQHLLVLLDSSHDHFADQIVFLQGQLLEISAAAHGHFADSLDIIQQHLLALLDSEHAHIADSIDVIQQHLLALSDTNHDHNADNLAVVQQHLLSILDTDHAHTADVLALIQQHLLALAGADHDHNSDNLTLQQIHELIVAGAQHGHTAGNLTLLIGTIFLAINAALHGQAADGLTLQQQHLLAIAEAYHAHSAEEPNLTMALILAIADALHNQGAEGITLTQNHILAAESALHALFADSLDLTQAHSIEVADALHSMFSENQALLQEHNINIGDSLHTQTSDNIVLFLQGQGLGVVTDAGIIKLTPQRGKLILTIERSTETVTVDLSALSV